MNLREQKKGMLKASLLMILLIIWASVIKAESIGGLYEATVELQSMDEAAKENAFQQALHKVLVKVTGQSDILSNPQLKKLSEDPHEAIQQYSFRANNVPYSETTLISSEQLSVTFDENIIRDWLKDANERAWSKNRPIVLAWVALDESHERKLLNGSDNNHFVERLKFHALKHGVPLTLPIIDLTDMANVTLTDVWGQFDAVVRRASERYTHDVILIGAIKKTVNNKWHARWILDISQQLMSFDGMSDSYDELMKESISQLSALLKSHYSAPLVAENKTQVLLKLTGLQTVDDYIIAKNYLSQLAPVQSTTIRTVKNDNIIYELKLAGDVAKLRQAITLDHVFEPAVFDNAIAEQEVTLSYRWSP